MTATLVFVDCETTGLDPLHHEVYEVAVVRRRAGLPDDEQLWWLTPEHLDRADAAALRLGGYYRPDRVTGAHVRGPVGEVAAAVCELTAGATWVGAVPQFDVAFLDRLTRRQGHRLAHHYHLVDVETAAVGWLAAKGGLPPGPPWRSDDLARLCGVERPAGRHTAIRDARWVRDWWDALLPTFGGLEGQR